MSLRVLHEPDSWGLRGAWAAGVRSRLPAENRDFLKEIVPGLAMPLGWIHTLPAPKDSRAALAALAEKSAENRFSLMHPLFDSNTLTQVRAAGKPSAAQIRTVQRGYKRLGNKLSRKSIEVILSWWLDVDEYGERLLSALRAFRNNFYAEEEQRIASHLQTALKEARKSAETLPLPKLLENRSGGVQVSPARLDQHEHTILAPSFWATPFLVKGLGNAERCVYLFGARPADASLVPGEQIPDDLNRALKALADPTRLKILRYLSAEPHTPTELANKLRLRPPTVVHHLRTLRLAQLVHLTLTEEGRRYASRPAAVDETLANLRQFLTDE